MYRRTRFPAGLAVLFALCLFLAGCDDESSQGPRPPLVTSDACFALIVERPTRVLSGAADLWNAARLREVYGSSFEEYLVRTVPGALAIQAAVDRGRPLALVVVPAAPDSTDFRSLLLLPIKEGRENLAAGLATSSSHLVKVEQGYAVYTDGDPANDDSIEFPPSRPLNTSALNRYPSDSIKLWASPQALARSQSGGFEGFTAAVRSFVSPDSTRLSPTRMAAWGLGILDELASTDGAITVGRAGVFLRTELRAVKGSETERIILLGARGSSALDWAGQIDGKALLGAAWSADREFAAAVRDRLDTLEGAQEGPQLQATRALRKELEYKATGPRGALSIDVHYDQSPIAALDSTSSNDDIRQAIDRSFSIDALLFQELRDPGSFVSLLDAQLGDEAFLAALHEAAADRGLVVDIDTRRRDTSAAYAGEIGLRFGLSDSSRADGQDELGRSVMLGFLDSLSEKARFRWTTARGRVVVSTAPWEAIPGLTLRNRAPQSVTDDPAFAAFSAGLPGRTQFVFSVSTRRLMGLLKAALSPDTVDPDSFDCWYGYLSMANFLGQATADAGLFVPAGDIKALIEALGAPDSFTKDSTQ